VEFLLECVGFPPDQDLEALARTARERGEPVPWRGPSGEHLRLDLGAGLELRFDREEGSDAWSLHPHYSAAQRLRVAVEEVRALPDSPFDALLLGWANPAPPLEARAHDDLDESCFVSCMLTDARRLPAELQRRHVLAVSLAAFALDVEHVGSATEADARARAAALPRHRLASGGWLEARGGPVDPGGCGELSLPVLSVRKLDNPFTSAPYSLVLVDAPGRPLPLFVSSWQLDFDGLQAPEPGLFVTGTFLLTGRIAGGLASPSARVGRAFG
jgi:hypothetical protein